MMAESLQADSRVYTQAVRNINDGISLLNVAAGAIDALSQITTRQLELAQQACNGVFSTAQRSAMNAEVNALTREYNRILKTTSFNNRALFDTDQGDTTISIQAGYGPAAAIGFTLGSELARLVGDGTFGTSAAYGTG